MHSCAAPLQNTTWHYMLLYIALVYFAVSSWPENFIKPTEEKEAQTLSLRVAIHCLLGSSEISSTVGVASDLSQLLLSISLVDCMRKN